MNNLNIAKEECVQSVDVYSMQDYANIFVASNGHKIPTEVCKEMADQFLSSIKMTDEQISIINKKTVQQSKSKFWFEQRAGRITASSLTYATSNRVQTEQIP